MGQENDWLLDTHVHLDRPPLSENLQQETGQARQAGVGGFIVPGVRRADWLELLQVVRSIPGALAAPGLHPLAAHQWDGGAARELAAHLGDPAVVAVGEIGLDAIIDAPALDVQERALRGQLRLAVATGKPVLIHCRRATGRLLDILRDEGAERVGGIFHGFSGSRETALAAIGLGFAIGFGGPLTYPNARRAPEVLGILPEEWLVIETDAPDLSPHPRRGESNRPAFLPLIAARMAEIRGWTLVRTARVTTANARRVLKL